MTTPAKRNWGNPVLSFADIVDPNVLAKRISGGADVNALCNGGSPIEIAVLQGKAQSCEILLAAGARPERRDVRQHSALSALFAKRNLTEEVVIQIAGMLIAAGANPNGLPERERGNVAAISSPIYQAARNGWCAVVKALVQMGADPNASVYRGGETEFMARRYFTPLAAVLELQGKGPAQDQQETMIALLDAGASEQCLCIDGRSAFQRCVESGWNDLVIYYVRVRGEDLAQRTVSGRSLLQIARYPSTRKLLRSLRTELEIQDALPAKGVEAKDFLPAKGWGPKIEGRQPTNMAAPLPTKRSSKGLPPL